MKSRNREVEMNNVAYRLKTLRTRKGFSTSEEFSKNYNLPQEQYNNMESGRSTITLVSLIRVLDIHELSLEDFFCMDLKKAAA